MFRIKTSQIHSGFRHQSGQLRNGRSCASMRSRHTVLPVHKVQWFEHDVCCPSSIWCLQRVSDHTLGGDREPFLRYRRAGDIAAQALLKKRGFEFDRQAAGSHEIWFNPATNRYTTILNHPGDMPEGTLRAIIKQAGITTEQFLQP